MITWGVEFCSLRIDQDAHDADGEMSAVDETDLTASQAEMNLPPVGTHETPYVPEEMEKEGATFTPESHVDD